MSEYHLSSMSGAAMQDSKAAPGLGAVMESWDDVDEADLNLLSPGGPSEKVRAAASASSRRSLKLRQGDDAATASTHASVEIRKQVRNSALINRDTVYQFNVNPKRGVKDLTAKGLLSSDPAQVALFLFEQPGLSKKKVGEYLGGHGEFNLAVLEAYVDLFGDQFTDLALDVALRTFLAKFKLPGEAQQIDRILERFARLYYEKNSRTGVFAKADVCFILAFSLIMLNTDLHNDKIKVEKKMTKEQFVSNNRGINGGKDVPRSLLESMYERIKSNEIRLSETDMCESDVVTFMAPTYSGWLYKQGVSRLTRWKKYWFVLSDHVLYYFVQPKDPNPRCIIPLEGCAFQSTGGNKLGLSIRIYRPDGAVIKSVSNKDAKAGGTLGQHKEFILRASSTAECGKWLNALHGLSGPDTGGLAFDPTERRQVDRFNMVVHRKKLRMETGSWYVGAPDKEGWLLKRGYVNKAYKLRYFLLYGSERPDASALATFKARASSLSSAGEAVKLAEERSKLPPTHVKHISKEELDHLISIDKQTRALEKGIVHNQRLISEHRKKSKLAMRSAGLGEESALSSYDGPRLYYFANEADARKMTSEGVDESKGFIDLKSVSNIHLVEETKGSRVFTAPWAASRSAKDARCLELFTNKPPFRKYVMRNVEDEPFEEWKYHITVAINGYREWCTERDRGDTLMSHRSLRIPSSMSSSAESAEALPCTTTMVFDSSPGKNSEEMPALQNFLLALGMGDLYPIFLAESINSKDMLQDMCREDSAYFEKDLRDIGISDEATRLRLMGALMRPEAPPPPRPPSGAWP